MDPITGSLVVGGVGSLAGGVLGDLFGSGDKKRARAALEAALRDIQGVNAEAGPTAFGQIQSDPRLRAAQVSALEGLSREGKAGGLGIESRAALNEANNETARRERGSREAITQNFAARGMGGSGTELAAALQNQQGAADRTAASGTAAAADARRRALGALAQSGEMAGGIRGQDFGEAASKADASDAMSRFNAGARLSKAGMMSNVRMGQANQAQADADAWTRKGSALGSAAGAGLGAVGAKRGWF